MRYAHMADHLMPKTAKLPDIHVARVQTRSRADSWLGAKGAGASAAVMNAITDPLTPLSAEVRSQPITPQKVLRALARVGGRPHPKRYLILVLSTVGILHRSARR